MPALYWLVVRTTDSRAARTASSCTFASFSAQYRIGGYLPVKVNWRYSRLLLRKRRGVPAAAQRLHQGRGRDEPPAENADRGALVAELGGLHRHHVDVAHDARLVLVGREDDRLARGAHGVVLHLRLLFCAVQDRWVSSSQSELEIQPATSAQAPRRPSRRPAP